MHGLSYRIDKNPWINYYLDAEIYAYEYAGSINAESSHTHLSNIIKMQDLVQFNRVLMRDDILSHSNDMLCRRWLSGSN